MIIHSWRLAVIPFNGSLYSQPSVDNFKDILFEVS